MFKKIDWQDAVALWETRPEIIAVWAFGSAQEGEIRVGSDVGVGRYRHVVSIWWTVVSRGV